ncbi:MAG: hypothetical protein PHS57_01090 [Alphaproteobacteria bacterium]|nr:hypothetical protein [Alphaproteobacteria bacterium]
MATNTAITKTVVDEQEPNAQAEVFTAEILQGNFASDADREEFAQAIKMHGVTFLYLANASQPQPSPHDLNVMGKLGRALSRFWPEALVIGGCHD